MTLVSLFDTLCPVILSPSEWKSKGKMYMSKGLNVTRSQSLNIQSIFEEIVEKFPDNVAIVYEGKKITYRELNTKANQLAHNILSTVNLEPDNLIALYLNRNEYMLISILAVLKTGAAYVPIDPKYPSERVNYILSDTQAKLVITNEEYLLRLDDLTFQTPKLPVDKKLQDICPAINPPVITDTKSLAYVIYTSGTTGNPKGVMVEQGSVLNLASFKLPKIDLLGKEKINNYLFYANYVFDAHVWEIYSCLLNGHILYIVDDSIRQDIESLQIYIKKNKINIALIPPALLDTEHLLKLDLLLIGGEKISQSILQKYLDSKIITINAYGPTEATVMSSCNLFRSVDDVCNIGWPLKNYEYYVVNEDLTITDDDEIGELCIGGMGLARGYLNNEKLTKEMFIIHPVLDVRMYKTGDLVRRLIDGSLEYIGRNDSQVKIRGHRIELGEIEALINLFPDINQTVVITSSMLTNVVVKNQFLIAYYTSNKFIDENGVRSFLSSHLPEYMVPNILIKLEKMPLTINGKINRYALPLPLINASDSASKSRNKIDEEMIEVWSKCLDVDQSVIGINDDFFQLGGNSILAIKLVKELNIKLNLNFSAIDLFELKNIKNMSDVSSIQKESQTTMSLKNQVTPSEKLILRDYYSSEYKNIYNESFVVEINDFVDENKFKRAVSFILDKYEVLNSNYQNNDGCFYRTLNKISFAETNYMDLSESISFEQDFISQINANVRKSFDIGLDKLIRFSLFKFSNNKFKLLIVFFHALLDGTSVINLLLPNLYKLLFDDQKPEKLTLDSFCLFSNRIQHIYDQNIESKLQYWSSFFSNAEPCCLGRPGSMDSNNIAIGRQEKFVIDSACKSNLIALSKMMSISIFDILAGCFVLILNKFSQKNCLTIRTNIDERVYDSRFSDTMGCFINNLFLKADIDSIWSLRDLFLAINQSKIDSISNLVRYDDLLIHFRDKVTDLSKIHFNIEPESYDEYEYTQTQTETHSGEVKNDLYFELDLKKDCIVGRVEYKTAVYNNFEINAFIASYKYVLEQVCILIDHKISAINILSASELDKIINNFNQNFKTYSDCKSLVEVFEEQVARTPVQVALVCDGVNISYRELNSRSNRFASYLREQHDIQPDDLICLCLDKNAYMIEAILGVLKSGGGYVPMEPGYPSERIHHIAKDTNSKLVITNTSHRQQLGEVLSELVVDVLVIDSPELQMDLADYSPENLQLTVSNENLAYVIYTSGTTGQPKGVLQTHGNVSRLLSATEALYGFNAEDVWTLFHAYVFDFSVWELWGALAYGGKLVVPSHEQTRDFAQFHALCSREGVTVLNQTPSAFYQFMELALEQKLPSLRYVIFGGEALHLPKLKPWFASYGDETPKLINMYGITETTIHVTYHRLREESLGETSRIGKVLPNLTTYVLDSGLNPVPVGAIGELYVGGSSLARGYLNQPELTQERFIPNPFHLGRLYKTGDLVRWLPDGSMEYIGRNDLQVKIRGYRIELGEIESALLDYTGIKQAVVLARKNEVTGSYSLVGYYVAEEVLEERSLNSYLSTKLPDYMIPHSLMHLMVLPLTVNGKLDRSQLPEADFKTIKTYVAPRNESEREVTRIWSEVLRVPFEALSIRDDFFRMGGDSIVSIQLVSRMRQRLGLMVSVRAIFTCRTIERLFDEVVSHQSNEALLLKSEQGLLEGGLPLLPIQRWFFSQKLANPHHHNQSFLIQVPALDVSRLQAAVDQLIAYHDCFRLRYFSTGEGYYSPSMEYGFHQLDVSEVSEEALQEVLTQWQNQWEMDGQSPLFAVGYLSGYADGSARIYFALHHLLVDVVSWRIVAEDLRRLYHGESLEEKGSSYRQWAEVINAYALSHQDEKNYWESVVADYAPIAFSGASEACSIDLALSKESTRRLLQESGDTYNTQINDILLTALGLSLVELSGQTVNHVVLEGHGREELDSQIDVSRTLGWFTSLYPVRLCVCSDVGLSLKGVKDNLRQIPHHGIGYGALLGYEQHALPSVSFNYLGQLDNVSPDHWSLCADAAGSPNDARNSEPYLINMNGAVIAGHLQFNLVSQLPKADAAAFAERFQHNLEALIEHTTSQTRRYLTSSDVAYVVDQDYLDELQQSQEIEGVYKASSLQQGFIYHALSQGEADEAYRVQIVWQYNNYLNVENLKNAWRCAQEKYPALRLRFAWDDVLVQIIDCESQLDWHYLECSDEARIEQIKTRDRSTGYNLAQAPLFRICLIKQNETKYTCIFNNHHAILDGWGVAVLLDYVHETYTKLCANQPVDISVDRSYQEAQRYIQTAESDKAYWDNYLSQIEERMTLDGLLDPTQHEVIVSEYKHIQQAKEARLTLDASLHQKLNALVQQYGVTLNALLQYAWHKLLSVYSNSSQTVVGTVVSGRNIPVDNLEHSVGLYINTLPLLVNHGEQTVIEIIQTIQHDINEANSRSKVNLADLQSGGQRLFDSLFVYENYPVSKVLIEQSGLDIHIQSTIEKLDYPLALVVYENSNNAGITLSLNYAGELFSFEKIQALLGIIKSIIHQVTKSNFSKAAYFQYLNEFLFNKVVHDFNINHQTYSECKTLVEVFEEQVARTPDQVALVCDGVNISYRELNSRSNRFASYLREQHDIQPDDLICLCLDKNAYMIEAILGVLKSGGGYVPMEPGYPSERIHHIAKDTNSKLVITNTSHRQQLGEVLSELVVDVLVIDSPELQMDLADYSPENLQLTVSNENLAYVIYTSGTTGQPKGVLQTHGNVSRLLSATEALYGFNAEDVWTLFHAYVFDFSVWELWGALAYGGKLVVPSHEQTRDFAQFHALCSREGVTVLNQTPSAFYQFMELALEQKLPSLRYVIFGGEALHLPKLKPWFASYGDETPKLINMYGITETTIHVTYHRLREESLGETSRIGKVLPNLTTYVLDSGLNPVPVGAIGELYVGGSSLARGYLNQPELTQERFIPNPFHLGRLYKTGDLVRWLPDGSMEYIGRNDLQVKIRGYRIELGEIESALLDYTGIKQAVVLARKNEVTGSYSLVGYYVAEEVLEERSLNSYLSTKLPDYMIPHSLMHLMVLPLTVNGKLDRSQLPEADFKTIKTYVAPRNESEREVTRIWSEVLRVPFEALSIRDDFFRMGGDSIVSIQLVSRMRQRLGLMVSVRAIFTCRTIERLFDEVVSHQSNEALLLKSEQGLLEGGLPLLPIQRWFFSQKLANPHHHNQSFLIQVPALDVSRLQAAVDQLIAYHDCFRLRYFSTGEGYYSPSMEYGFHQLDVSEVSEEALQEVLTQWQNQWEMDGQSPLFAVGYLSGYADGSARIYFALHHLLVDVVSWRIVAEDLRRLYHGESLEEKGSSYRQWAEVINAYALSHQDEKNYWESVVADYAPIAFSGASEACSIDLALSKESTRRLLQESGDTYNTQINDILLTALGLSLVELSGQTVNHVVLEGHGREELDSQIDVSRTLGWFTSLYPVRLCVCSDVGLSLKGVKDNLRQIPHHGIGYGALLGYEQHALPSVSFNYLGQLDNVSPDHWSLCADAAGSPNDARNSEPYLINMNGAVIAGHLQFNLVSQLPKADAAAFAERFQHNLEALIEHTTSQTRRYLTSSDVAYVVDQDYLDELQQSQEIEGVYKASSLQQGFIYHALSQGEADEAYRVQIVWQYNNYLNVENLKNAWRCAQEKYPALRLRFAWDDVLVQIIDCESQLDWHYLECSDEARIEQIKTRDRSTGYNLAQAPLFRICLIKQNETKYTCIFNNHHAILDGWGVAVLLDYVHETYTKLCANQPVDISVDRSYQEAQRYIQTAESDKAYWDNYLSQIEERMTLDGLLDPTQHEVIVSEYKHIQQAKEARLTLDASLHQKLNALVQQYGVTLNALLQYAWHKLLSVYSNSSQTVVGTVVSGRNIPVDNLEHSVGLYINTLPLLVNHGEQTVIEIIQTIQHDINEANSRSKVNLADLQSGGQRLFDSLFVYENYPVSSQKNLELQIEFELTSTKLDYPLALICEDDIRLRYAAELFTDEIINELLTKLTNIMAQVVIEPNQPAKNINVLSADEYNRVVYEKNDTSFTYPNLKTLHALFFEQVEKTPDNIALEFNDRTYTYLQVNQIATQFAFILQKKYGIKNGDIVGLFIERSEFTFITILAVLKSGAAYLPIDVSFPDERISYMLDDAQVKLVLTTKPNEYKIEQIKKGLTQSIIVGCIDNKEFLEVTDITEWSTFSIDLYDFATNSDLAYVIYTSGTTGKPKGVMIEHGSIVSRLLYLKQKHSIGEQFTFGAKTPYVFDPSIRELFLPLINGARVVIFSDEDIKDVDRILELSLLKKINGLLFVPSQLAIFVEALKNLSPQILKQLAITLIYSCGEILPKKLVYELFQYIPSLEMKNQYGPTEGCQFLFENDINLINLPKEARVPVGTLVGNMRAYVLDKNMNLLPELAIGELYITGDGLSRGYINNKQLTDDKFIVNPFQSEHERLLGKNNQLYKTGDMVRWLSNGNLEYLGRSDFQVKIRGHRIDLGEIENSLLEYPEIKQTVLIARKDSDGFAHFLVAYYVSDKKIPSGLLLNYLRKKLPDYMLPRAIIHLDKMPITINGKLNRAALPKYDVEQHLSDYRAPVSEMENVVCNIYAEILGLSKVGLDSNFFHLGGNSISSFKLVNRLRVHLMRDLNIKNIYEYPTVQALISYCLKIKSIAKEGIEIEF